MENLDPKSAAILNRFLRGYVSDRAAGVERGLEAYQALYPGFEELVASEYARLQADIEDERPEVPWTHLPAGRKLGHYEIERELGRGGQGTVFLARDTRLNRRVAIKVLTGLASISREHVARFHREAALASRLDHPGICTVYGSDTQGGVPFVVMRHVEGETLAQVLSRARDAGELPKVGWALSVVERAARALHVAHEAGIVHRDIKPSNLMLTPEGEPVVLDFGLARDIEGGHSVTGTGDVFGTPAYMAPEQIRGRAHPDRRVDVYALGVVLYEALTLDVPFRAPTLDALYRKVLVERAAPARRGTTLVASDLRVVLDTALEKDGERRYASARDLAEDLLAIRESRPIAARPVGSTGRLIRWARREPAKAVLVTSLAVALVSLSALAGYLLARAPELRAGERELMRKERDELVSGVYGSHYTASYEELQSMLEEDPRNGAMRLAVALLEYNRMQLAEALRILDAEPAGGSQQRTLERMRIQVLEELGRGDEAAQRAQVLGAPREASEYWFVGHGLLYGSRSSAEDAQRGLDMLKQAVYLAPSPQHFLLDLIVASSQFGDVDTARMAEASLLQNHADSALAWFAIAAARTLYDESASRDAIERAIELDPGFAGAHATYAAHLLIAGEVDAAYAAHERAIANIIGGPKERRDLTLVFAELLPPSEALEQLDEILSEFPDDVEALATKAERLFELGEDAWATEVLQRALSIDPAHPLAQELAGR